MNDEQVQTLARMQAFLDGTVVVEFAVVAKERYGSIGRTVQRFGYARLKHAEKAVALHFLERVSVRGGSEGRIANPASALARDRNGEVRVAVRARRFHHVLTQITNPALSHAYNPRCNIMPAVL